jgi:integrase
MAWLEKRPGGYVVRWREGGREAKAECSPVYARKDQASAKAREIAAAVAARKPAQSGVDLPLAEIFERYSQRRLTEGARAIHVERTRRRIVSVCVARGWSTCRSITPQEVASWRKDGGCQRTGACLRAALRWAMETFDQPVDPRTLVALRPRPIGRRPRADLVTREQVEAWQESADQIDANVGALVHCLATYGWRPITAADLIVKNLDLKTGCITTTVKGGDVVRHPLLPATLDRLRPLVVGRSPSAPLFLHPNTQKAWEAGSPERGSIPKWCRVALDLKTYDLKRYAISTMLELKMEPQTVALFTGHRTLSQVLTYARTNESRAREALKMMTSPVGTSGHGPSQPATTPDTDPVKTPVKT